MKKDVVENMIEVDISNIWGAVALSDLLEIEKDVAQAHELLTERCGAGSEYLQWLELPVQEETEEMLRIRQAAEQIRKDSDVCVVVGIGGSYLGARAVIELLQGPNHNIGKGKGNIPEIGYFSRSHTNAPVPFYVYGAGVPLFEKRVRFLRRHF